MVFNSLEFLVFFFIVYALYLALQRAIRWQNAMLLVASYVFYGMWDWRFLSLLFISTALDYICAIRIAAASGRPGRRKIFLAISIVGNLTMLGFFKYYNFFADNLHSLLGAVGCDVHLYALDVILPVGISFYTFQTMSYVLDVYREKMEPVRRLDDFALFVAFFPQLVAGPIERAPTLAPQLMAPRTLRMQEIQQGIFFIFWGLFLKVFMADNLADMVEPVFAAPPPYNGVDVLLAVYAFTFQILGDFGGYSLIAVGLGKMMGVTLIENFKTPYLSKNISEFWQRWHISLSRWIRDYVFFPLYETVDRRGWFRGFSFRARQNLAFFTALMGAEILLGLWHGASWNFVLFGLYHGLLIWLYYLFQNPWDAMPAFLRTLLTFHLAALGWLIFRAQSLTQIGEMCRALIFSFGSSASESSHALATARQILFYVWPLVLVEYFQHRTGDTAAPMKWPTMIRWFFYVWVVALSALWGDFEGRQFIYFQF